MLDAARSFCRTIDTLQLKCDVCPPFKLYNVFLLVDTCRALDGTRSDPGEKGARADMEIYLFQLTLLYATY